VPHEASSDTQVEAASPRLERKTATVLFADLVGYTGLNERHDPEFVQSLTSATFDRLSAEAARYDGLIEKFAGDAMLVLFGVPQIHEDDPERAVRAALEMQAAMGELAARSTMEMPLRLRIGIESGEILVDQARAAADRDRMVTGDAVNTAARLQAAAEAGSVVVGARTHAATAAVVEYEDVGQLTVKGKSGPVHAWRAVGVRARRGGFRAPAGLESALVGRESEMALLKETVRRMAADQRPHLITVVGAPGVGKSRLRWELEKYLDGLPDNYVWRQGRSYAYAQASLGALVEMVEADAGIREDEPSSRAAERLDERLGQLPRAASARDRDLLRGLLGIDEMPKATPDELFGALTRHLETLARVAPAVLVFEDIHWADDSVLDFIESLARWGTGPLLILCLARHELLERRPAWAGGISNATTIVLEPLDPTETARLLDGLVPGGIPRELRNRIVELADGNPLFGEELVRMFIDRGVLLLHEGQWQIAGRADDLSIPGTIQAVLAARLDALPDTEKHAAQDAAVVGRVFWDAVVADLMSSPTERVADLLRRLRVKELVVAREPSSFSGADEFSFRHVLIRDVAYESLPKRDRADKHLAVVEWAERELGERAGEAAELVASHMLAALRYREEFDAPAPELSALRAQAYEAVGRARDRAGLLHEKSGAVRWARIALDLAQSLQLPALERARAAAAFLQFGSGNYQREEAAAIGEAAIALMEGVTAHTAESDALEAEIRSDWAWVLLGQGRAKEARASLEKQLARLEAGEPSETRAWLLARIGWLSWRIGPAESGRPYLDRALSEARSVGSRRVEAWALHDLGVVAGQAGNHVEAASLIRQSLELALLEGDHDLTVRCYVNLPAMTMDNGPDWAELETYIHEGLALVRRASDREAEAWLVWQLADFAEFRGRMAEGLELRRQAADIAEQQGDVATAAVRRVGVAWMSAQLGLWEQAEAVSNLPSPAVHVEEQYEAWGVIWRAVRAWRRDPSAGVAEIGRDLPAMTVEIRGAALWAARMAYRVGDPGVMSAAISRTEDPLGPVSALFADWIRALAADSSTGKDRMAAVVAEADRLGYRNYAAMARDDLALATARAGSDAAAAVEDAKRYAGELGIEPLLGPLPESKWLATP
jgi:class 3 adenylate cyclase/tetratricopeptide (TPR) repeat protein